MLNDNRPDKKSTSSNGSVVVEKVAPDNQVRLVALSQGSGLMKVSYSCAE